LGPHLKDYLVPLSVEVAPNVRWPAFMVAVVTQMIDPRILIEIEAWAAKPIDGGN
jgi:enamine deaminase RidA (YjgF/YER057c/UK114 family)